MQVEKYPGVAARANTQSQGEHPETVRILAADSAVACVALAGSAVRAQTVVLRKGTTLAAAQIAVLASVGLAEVDVFAPPRVALLATGDELVEVGRPVGPAQIRNCCSPLLTALLRPMGCEVTDLGIVGDRMLMLRRAINRGLEFDAFFVTGSMSRGKHDYVPRLLAELGVQLKIAQLRIRPLTPLVFGLAEHCMVFGLSDNPVSGFVCTLRLASRLLARMSGGAVVERWVTGRLLEGLPANGPSEFYQPARLTVPPGSSSAKNEFAAVMPLERKGSGDVFTLAVANALLVRAENEPPAPKGTMVRVLEI